jgi:hypothetical protein
MCTPGISVERTRKWSTGATRYHVKGRGARTSRSKPSRVRVSVLPVGAQRGVWRWQSRSVRLVVTALATTIRILHRSALLRRGSIHGLLLLVALRRWSVLSLLAGLLLLRVLLAISTMWKRLTVGAVELRVRRWVLTAPNGVCRNECLSLGANRSEDAFLREPLAIGAATVI